MCAATSRVPYMGILAIIFITMTVGSAVAGDIYNATIGYDCGSKIQNMTTISLVGIDDCDLEVEQVKTSYENVALLQLNQFEHTEIIQCKVEISRIVYHCGMFSHNSIIDYSTYIRSITHDACQTAHEIGTLSIGYKDIRGLQVNSTISTEVVMAGTIESNGACTTGSFSDLYGNWADVAVIGTAKVTLTSGLARADVEKDTIYLPSGYRCKLSKEQCVDSDGGHTFWKSVPKRYCYSKTFSQLYKGNATKFESKHETVYSVNVDDTSFSLKIIGSEPSCGATLFKTESPKLFLIKNKDLQRLESSNIVDKHTDNLDLFQYVNNKFLYVERHLRSQVKSLYLDVMKHHCKLEKEMLKNTLAIASTQPDEFAFRYMDGPGYMAVMAGEVIHIVQCVPVEVKLNHVDECYNHLPVLRDNRSVFLMPRTHIITDSATKIPCNSPLLEHYKLQGTWYKFMPKPVEAPEPMKLKPSTKLTWSYQNPANLATSGIYTQEDLDSMRERIMFPIEQTVIAETVAQQFTNGMGGSPSIMNAFSDEMMDQLAETTWSRTWGKFIKFGTACSGFIGVFVCFSLLKTVADSVFNGFKLYKVFGFSVHLVAACWDNVANILLSKGKKKEKVSKAYLTDSRLNIYEKPDVEEGRIDREVNVPNSNHHTREVPLPAPRRIN